MKNDLSAHRQRVKNEMIIIIKTQQELRVYNTQNVQLKNRERTTTNPTVFILFANT